MDGTPGGRPGGLAGVAAVLRGPSGRIWAWSHGCAPAATCNEAEYQAVIFGLRMVLARFPRARVRCLTDSRVVAEQLAGLVRVRAGGLGPLHEQAAALARSLGGVRFVHIPRELNRLADALAWEALAGAELHRRLSRD